MLLIREVTGHPSNPVAAYRDLLWASPTIQLTVTRKDKLTVFVMDMLSRALRVIVYALGLQLNASLFYLHSLKERGATAASRAGIDKLGIKRHGMWASKAFWAYITAPCVCQPHHLPQLL